MEDVSTLKEEILALKVTLRHYVKKNIELKNKMQFLEKILTSETVKYKLRSDINEINRCC